MSNVIELPYANPINAELYRELGPEGYDFLMDIWASSLEGGAEFDECFDYYADFYGFDEEGFAQYLTEFWEIVKSIIDRVNIVKH
jgi:hypothetical protein